MLSKHDLEMAPLDVDNDDDEDMTVFEVNGIKWSGHWGNTIHIFSS